MTSAGLAMMVDAAERDEDIAAALISRKDLPHRVLADLVVRSTPRQQARLLKNARPEIQHAIRAAIDAGAARASASPPATIDYAEARATVMALNNSGQLNDTIPASTASRSDRKSTTSSRRWRSSRPFRLRRSRR